MDNYIEIDFTDTHEVRTSPLYQYDYGQILLFRGVALPNVYEVHFANNRCGESTTSIGGPEGVEIPDMYLQSGVNIYAWVFLHTGEDDSTFCNSCTADRNRCIHVRGRCGSDYKTGFRP